MQNAEPGPTRYWATRCWHWGRAVWRTEPKYSPAFRQFQTDPEGPPLASDTGGTGWVVDLLCPENLRADVDHICVQLEVTIATGKYAIGFGPGA